MARKYAASYIDRLLAGTGYTDLVELLSTIRSSPRFTAQAPDYGLPQFAFVFAETLEWFAQAIRSGVWTYYEAAPQARQEAMAAALRAIGPPGFAEQYEYGMANWQDEAKIHNVDRWIEANDDAANEWLFSLLRSNRDAVLDLSA